MSKNNNIHKVYYSAFSMTKEIQDYFNKLSMLVKLNLLLDKKLINNVVSGNRTVFLDNYLSSDFFQLIKDYNLSMKLISATYNFTKSQLWFKFYSDSRVDFRKLAKDLAKIYHTRIELRQVGVRDKAKEIGGCGQCGRDLCCKGFLKEFNSVSINMAKNQSIALNPNKINGICGRLLCCLKYENDCYKECRKNLPKIGEIVDFKSVKGKVINVDPLAQKFKVINEQEEIIVCSIDDCIKWFIRI